MEAKAAAFTPFVNAGELILSGAFPENVIPQELLQNTPLRFARAMQELLSGYCDDNKPELTTFDAGSAQGSIVIVDKITFSSLCEHHLLPFFGTVEIGYVTNHKILGLSKFARLVEHLAHKLQVQERLTAEIFYSIQSALEPLVLFVKVKATHTCMCSRGVKQANSETTTLEQGCLSTYRESDAHKILRKKFAL